MLPASPPTLIYVYVCVCILCIIYPFACSPHNVLAKQSADFLRPASRQEHSAFSACFKTAKNVRVYLFFYLIILFFIYSSFFLCCWQTNRRFGIDLLWCVYAVLVCCAVWCVVSSQCNPVLVTVPMVALHTTHTNYDVA